MLLITITKLVLITLTLQGLTETMKTTVATTSLTTECSTAIQQVTSCLAFATGKSDEPTKDCCTAVSSMKEKQPVCLCFFIGQAHNGTQEIKSLGIQEDKLMQLPTACHLTNVNIQLCPKLLGISPTSPAAAIFMHNNMTTPPTVASPLISSSSSPTNQTGDHSSGYKNENGFLGGFLIVIVSAYVCASTVGNSKFLL